MKFLFFISFLLISNSIVCQHAEKYWLYYPDNELNSDWRDSIRFWGIHESYYSEWLRASSIEATKLQRALIQNHPELTLQKQGELYRNSESEGSSENLSYALEQIGAEHFIKINLTGKGVKIGIIDGGFLGAPKNETLSHFFKNKQIAAYKDFITPKLKAYGGSPNLDDHHGTEVWEMLGGYSTEKEIRYGLATGATYYLARTDHGSGEKRIEEEYFVEALEWMSKRGVKLVNTSLGYTNGYDNESENYTPDQMDGSSAIAKATQYAIEKKGMIVVGAAGNEGNIAWKVINTPADAKDVIAVGASKNNLLDKMDYSSIGPIYLDYVKPELTCYSGTGTSFSTPVITGLIACMLEYSPSLTSIQVREILLKSCDLYPYGNNYIGYGNPSIEKIVLLLKDSIPINSNVKVIKIEPKQFSISRLLGKFFEYPDRFKIKPGNQSVVVYHKYDKWKVVEKKILIPEKKRITIKRHKNATQTTVAVGNSFYELFWN